MPWGRSTRQFVQATLLAVASLAAAELQPTLPAAGPYHVSANRIVDGGGRIYLVRGTELAMVTLDPLPPGDLGPLSASALVTIRQRLNMNAVWLPLIPAEYRQDPTYRLRVAEVVRTANVLGLLVILAPQPAEAPPPFWTALATAFRDNPNVFFAVNHETSGVAAIRAAGALQPILANAAEFPLDDPNIVYEAEAHYATIRTDDDRSRQFGALAGRVPVLVRGLDPELAEPSAECAAFPADPAAATTAVETNLRYFDSHQISWIISSFTPWRLITDTRFFNGTKLDDGWVCGARVGMPGIGLVLLSHLWQSDPHGLFAVNGDAGSFVLPRGGRAVAYGPILADREMTAVPGRPLPTRLANISVRVTDSRGVGRLAPLLYTGAGWAFLTFIVPEESANGLAEIAIERSDGSRVVSRSIVADLAPGILSASVDGRGPVKGTVTQRFADGSVRTAESFQCLHYGCATVPIALSRTVSTTLRVEGTGFRHARSVANVQVFIDGIAVPVLSFGAIPGAQGRDRVDVKLPDELIGRGETDLMLQVDGLWSNVVRVNCGGER